MQALIQFSRRRSSSAIALYLRMSFQVSSIFRGYLNLQVSLMESNSLKSDVLGKMSLDSAQELFFLPRVLNTPVTNERNCTTVKYQIIPDS